MSCKYSRYFQELVLVWCTMAIVYNPKMVTLYALRYITFGVFKVSRTRSRGLDDAYSKFENAISRAWWRVLEVITWMKELCWLVITSTTWWPRWLAIHAICLRIIPLQSLAALKGAYCNTLGVTANACMVTYLSFVCTNLNRSVRNSLRMI